MGWGAVGGSRSSSDFFNDKFDSLMGSNDTNQVSQKNCSLYYLYSKDSWLVPTRYHSLKKKMINSNFLTLANFIFI